MTTQFKKNDAVRWTSSCLDKTGIIVDIVPAGKVPYEINPSYKRLEGSLPRKEESYIVRGKPTGRKKGVGKLYWPRTSLLRHHKGLTQEEKEWCSKNVNKIREMMKNEQES